MCRVPRKRISIPLKDKRTFDRQIQVHIKDNFVALAVPIEAKVKKHQDYTNTVYIYIGNQDMFTLSNEHVYGTSLSELIYPETERLAKKNQERHRVYTAYRQNVENGNRQKTENIEANNLGRHKYDSQKEKEKRRTTNFINTEMNRMFRTEKPARIVITKPVTKNKTKLYSKSGNRKLTRNFRGYIRERLIYKCQVNAVELVELNSKGTGRICSACGAEGKRQGKEFACESCGLRSTIALNSAKNIQQKYMENQKVRMHKTGNE